jgi:hypothetical protein
VIAREEHLESRSHQSTRFRIVTAPSIVNPAICKLWLIPVGAHAGRMESQFQDLIEKLRALYTRANTQGVELHVYALVPKGHKRFSEWGYYPDCLGVGEVRGDGKKPVHLTFRHSARQPLQKELASLIAECGAALPNRIRESIYSSLCATAGAWWMCAVWRYSRIRPLGIGIGYLEKIEKDPKDPDNDKLHWKHTEQLGWNWADPVGASLSAIEEIELVLSGHGDPASLPGDWLTDAISKAEFARRMSLKKKARARDVERLFRTFQKIQVGKNSWMFRLDTLTPDQRKKLEGGGKP